MTSGTTSNSKRLTPEAIGETLMGRPRYPEAEEVELEVLTTLRATEAPASRWVTYPPTLYPRDEGQIRLNGDSLTIPWISRKLLAMLYLSTC